MATKKMNVLIYSGNGSTTESVRHCLYTLRRLLSPAYAVIPVTGDIIINEPWQTSCALLVFPGGADLGYCRTLNGEGNRRISRYVNGSGSYLGFCAGGYYGSQRCEFEVDDPKMAVVGERELSFFPGICRGLAFEGFVYHSEAGARAANVKIEKEAFDGDNSDLLETFKSYYNGGGVFVDAKKLENRGVQVLASYTEDLHVDSGEGKAAVVYRKIGEGHAILTGPHPEFAPQNLTKSSKLPAYSEAIDAITATDSTRIAFLRLALQKLSLKVNEEEQAVPPLSRLHLSAHSPTDVADLVASWSESITIVDGEEYLRGGNDVFRLDKEGSVWGVKGLKKAIEKVGDALPAVITGKVTDTSASTQPPQDKTNSAATEEAKPPKSPEDQIRDLITYTNTTTPDAILDYNKIIKSLFPHTTSHPSPHETPSFHHETYYANLAHHHSKASNHAPTFGRHLVYGDVVTSTNTLLEKNAPLLRTLPTGFTFTATTQLAGRGRGTNVWVAPPGALMFSTVLHHSFTLTQTAPVIFIQYIAALAIVRGIKTYAPGYDQLAIKLKWPNDIYAQLPGSPANPLVKIGGILVNSSYTGTSYSIVCGIGLNLSNPLPTTSLNSLIPSLTSPTLKPLTHEKLLASILAAFEALYRDFCRLGWSSEMESEYYEHWLHGGQVVAVETEEVSGVRALIRGITRDWGLLLAEELGWEDRPTGRLVALQSDSNSFDFFRGLVRRKV
ncbi:biotin apo-protein ligase-like protein [Byssothecium circinans]|uniref:Biotin apo-protein ligase-like protein n=1 Tax=Byssothecium circinans TaxID=147558 RepID=A0A6A5U4X7_9PLEO|nr:biotin apo-protein ligase-like protein [Byssothecium circinans]